MTTHTATAIIASIIRLESAVFTFEPIVTVVEWYLLQITAASSVMVDV